MAKTSNLYSESQQARRHCDCDENNDQCMIGDSRQPACHMHGTANDTLLDTMEKELSLTGADNDVEWNLFIKGQACEFVRN